MVCRKSGFTIIELLAAMIFMVVGLVGLMASIAASSRLAEAAHDTDLCAYSIRNVVGAVRSVPLSDIPTEFAEGSARESFWCDRNGNITFGARPDEGAIGEGAIEVFADESEVPEDFGELIGGMDLNGDGGVTSGVSAAPLVLPVRITLTLDELMEPRTVTLHLILTPPNPGS